MLSKVYSQVIDSVLEKNIFSFCSVLLMIIYFWTNENPLQFSSVAFLTCEKWTNSVKKHFLTCFPSLVELRFGQDRTPTCQDYTEGVGFVVFQTQSTQLRQLCSILDSQNTTITSQVTSRKFWFVLFYFVLKWCKVWADFQNIYVSNPNNQLLRDHLSWTCRSLTRTTCWEQTDLCTQSSVQLQASLEDFL